MPNIPLPRNRKTLHIEHGQFIHVTAGERMQREHGYTQPTGYALLDRFVVTQFHSNLELQTGIRKLLLNGNACP